MVASDEGCDGAGSNEASVATASLSCLAALFDMKVCTACTAACGLASGTLARPRMVAVAAPTTSKQVSAMMVTDRVKPLSISVGVSRLFHRELGIN